MNKSVFIFIIIWILAGFSAIPAGAENIPKYSDDEFSSLLKKAETLLKEMDYPAAYHQLSSLGKSAEKNHDIKNLIKTDLELGNFFMELDENEFALSYYLKSLKLSEEHKIDDFLGNIYRQIGKVYALAGNFAEAENYFVKSVNYSKTNGEKAGALMEIAGVKEQNNTLDSALYYYAEALQKAESPGNKNLIWNILDKTGLIYFKKGEYNLAGEKFSAALSMANGGGRGIVHLHAGNNFLEIGWPDSAIYHLTLALDFLNPADHKNRAEAYFSLLKTEQEMGNAGDALSFLTAFKKETDEEFRALVKREKAKSRAKFELGKEASTKGKAGIIANPVLLFGGAALLLILLTVLVIVITRNRNKLARKQQVIEQKENTLKNLEKEKENAVAESKGTINEFRRKLLHAGNEKSLLERELRNLREEMKKEKAGRLETELESYVMRVAEKNGMLAAIENISAAAEEDDSGISRELRSLLEKNNSSEKDWKAFKNYFSKVHPGTLDKVKTVHPELSENELRLAALLATGLKAGYIYHFLRITPETYRKRKQRLRNKLGIDSQTDIVEYLRMR